MTQKIMNGVLQQTFDSWVHMLDPNKTWLRGETVNRQVVRVWCAVCAKHVERLKGFRNFSEAFVHGITGSCVKRDAISKHMTSSAHCRAEELEKGPLSVADLYKTTAIGMLLIMHLILKS